MKSRRKAKRSKHCTKNVSSNYLLALLTLESIRWDLVMISLESSLIRRSHTHEKVHTSSSWMSSVVTSKKSEKLFKKTVSWVICTMRCIRRPWSLLLRGISWPWVGYCSITRCISGHLTRIRNRRYLMLTCTGMRILLWCCLWKEKLPSGVLIKVLTTRDEISVVVLRF